MFRTEHIYTVHQRDRDGDLELVREGFSFWAFFFTLFWLLFNRLWAASFVYLLLMVVLMRTVAALGLGEVTLAIAQFAAQWLLGCMAHDLQRIRLAKRGYRMVDVVVSTSELAAAQRAYDRIPNVSVA